MGRRIRNWDRSQCWQPEEILHPESEEAVVEAVRRAAEAADAGGGPGAGEAPPREAPSRGAPRIKAVGSALSWSDCFDIPAVAMRFDRMAQILEVDPEGRRVRLQPGAVLRDVNEALAEAGLAFDNFGSIVLQTAAGYIGTGSHGTGARTPILASYIAGMRLVDGLGQVHVLDADHEPELFRAARVHLGCLGVVTEITFRCVEAFDVEEQLQLVPWDNLLSDLDTYVDDNDYCKLWWFPYTDEVQVYTFNRTHKPRGGFGFTGWLDGSGISGAAFTAIMGVSRAVPPLIPGITRGLQRIHFHPRRRVDRSDKVIRVSSGIPRHQESEYAVPRERAAEAIDATRQLVLARKREFRVNFPMEVRFVAADDIPMSPTSGRESCYVGAYVASRKWARAYHAAFQELMQDFAGRPHWGKTFDRTAEQLRALYPGYDAFNALRRQCDPYGLFRNRFVDRVFPPG